MIHCLKKEFLSFKIPIEAFKEIKQIIFNIYKKTCLHDLFSFWQWKTSEKIKINIKYLTYTFFKEIIQFQWKSEIFRRSFLFTQWIFTWRLICTREKSFWTILSFDIHVTFLSTKPRKNGYFLQDISMNFY